MLRNQLEIFKEHSESPHMKANRGQEKIFFHHLCTGNHNSYNIDKVNKIFEDEVNTDGLMFNVTTLIGYLQEGYNRGGVYIKLNGEKDPYKHASEDYPKLYKLLAMGLSEESLKTIEKLDMEQHFKESSSYKVKEKFNNQYSIKLVDTIRKDRVRFELSNSTGQQI